MKQALGQGLGQISRALGSHGVDPRTGVRALNRLQKFLCEETRLGIPALSHEECLVGLMARGATMFPSALVYGATWNPDLVERAAAGDRARGPRAWAATRDWRPCSTSPATCAGVAPRRRSARIRTSWACMGTRFVRGLQGETARSARHAEALRRPLVERGRAQPRAGAPGVARTERRLPAPVRDGGQAGARRVGDAGVSRHRQRIVPRARDTS